MDERLARLEDKQMDVMTRLSDLSMGVEALRNKTEQNRHMAKEAKALANNATQLASSLDQVSVQIVHFFKRVEMHFMASATLILQCIK